MVTIESTTVVQRPVNMVFNFTADVDNLPLWMQSVLSARRLSHGPMGVGTRFRDRIGLIGRSFEADFELTAYEPGRRLAFRSVSGPFPLETDERFEPLGDDTRITMTVRAEPGGFRIDTVPERLGTAGDPSADIDLQAGSLDALLELARRDEEEGLGDAPWPPHFPKQRGEPKRVQPSRDRERPQQRGRVGDPQPGGPPPGVSLQRGFGSKPRTGQGHEHEFDDP
jgi:uncharacterized protein YndB with AHSA1/START domain